MELNGDQRLGAGDRVRYLLQNARRNLLGLARPGFRRFTQWRPPAGAIDGVAAPIASPGRKLAEAFMVFGLPQHLPPGEISVLEIGCGSGRARDLLARAGYTGHYTGLDVFDRFNKSHGGTAFESEFRLMDAHDIEIAPRFDLIMSNSALEHIEDDAKLVARLRTCLRPGGVQFHIVPSGAALPAYLWHGYRQYAGRALAERFTPEQTEVWALGGLASLMAHIFWITLPEQLGR
ncbi:MAG: class I SAM-dependent methyltransferase, partial [Alphaproteobacteria bacterium]